MEKPIVAITGATGYIGINLIRALAPDHKIIALYREQIPIIEGIAENAEIEWRQVDFFSISSAAAALKGADYAFYLIHSMLPTTRLFQGNFADTDLLLADNFVRGCKANGIKQIIYLGGLVPQGKITSKHLASRKEVEDILRGSLVPCTLFRASMVVGKGGSSFEILHNLVKNLPLMLLPKWTENTTEAIYIGDVMRVFRKALGNKEFFNHQIDLVNGEFLTYKELLVKTARGLGLKRIFIPFPFNLTMISKRWVSIFGNAHINLVSPLVDSLLVSLPTPEVHPLIKEQIKINNFEQMMKLVKNSYATKGTFRKYFLARKKHESNSVRSIQRLPSCPQLDSKDICTEYTIFLHKLFRHIIKVKLDTNGNCKFILSLVNLTLLELTHVERRSDEHRHLFYITGGVLVKRTDYGWLDFRQVDNKRFTLAVIHEYIPKVPWYIYRVVQAPIHKLVMHLFGKYLTKKKQMHRDY